MAAGRVVQSARSEPTRDLLRELAEQLRGDRADRAPDPTANVLKLVDAAISRQDDLRKGEFRRIDELRKQEAYWSRELIKSERRAASSASLAEQRRVDALFAAAASERALERTRAEGTAAALAERVDAAQKALAVASGAGGQRLETGQFNRWLGSLLAAIAGAAAAYLALHR